jgi:MFS family permease
MLKQWSVVLNFNGDVKRLLAAWGLGSFGYLGIVGVLFNLYLLRLGYDIEFIGLLIGSGQFVWAVASLPAGMFGRRVGLRTAIILGYVLGALGMGLVLLVEYLPRPMWIPWIYVAFLGTWVGAAFNTVNSPPFMMAVAGADRKHAFAALTLMTAMMSAVGGIVAGIIPGALVSIFGGSLESPTPFRITLWLTPIFYMVAALAMTGATPIKLESVLQVGQRARAPLGLFVFLGLVVFLLATGGGGARAFFNVLLDTDLGVPAAQIGAIMGIAQFLPVFVTLFTPQLLDRFGAEVTLLLVGVAMAAALVIMGIATHWLPAAIGFAAVVSLVAVAGTSQNLWSQELVAEHWRSISAAVLSIGLALGWGASAAMGGFLVEAVGFRGYFFVGAALVLTSSVILAGHRYSQRNRVQTVAAG